MLTISSNPMETDIIELSEGVPVQYKRNKIPAVELSSTCIALVGSNPDAVSRIEKLYAANDFLSRFNLSTVPNRLAIGAMNSGQGRTTCPILLTSPLKSKDWVSFSSMFPAPNVSVTEIPASMNKVQAQGFETILWVDYLLWNTERTLDTLYLTKFSDIVSEFDGALFSDTPNKGILPSLDAVFQIAKNNPLRLIQEPDWATITAVHSLPYIEQVKRRFAMMKKVWGS